ncbi:MAG: Group II intron-encoded protein LtrA [Syntrophomonadaceae bacterium]|nr:Group II intron-encoded protein LtrA [Bacillota bacterium]
MKRQGNLFQQIIEPGNIELAHQNAKKGKSHYFGVQMVEDDKERYLGEIHKMLRDKTFRTGKYKKRIVRDSGKKREISKLPYFPDRIVQHAIMNVLQPFWDKTFIYDCYSAVPGKGIHKGLERVRRFLKDKENTQYCLKFDVKQYYPSVNHEILMALIKQKIKCKDTLWLLEDIVRSTGGDVGISIGNYLSQYFAVIYLDGFDHWLKEIKRIKYYVRYGDDGVIFRSNKQVLHNLLDEMRVYLSEKLALELNHRTQIFPVDRVGVDFLGYRNFRNYSLLRKSSAKRFKRKIKAIEEECEQMDAQHIVSSLMSYIGWIQHCNGYNLLSKYVLGNERIIRAMDRASEELGIRNPIFKGETHGRPCAR